MQEKELSLSAVGRIRTAMAISGTIIGYASMFIGPLALSYSMLTIAICMSVYSCYLWAKLKGRHWIWMMFGLLAPAGFFALAMLQNRNKQPPPQPPVQ
jgi:hypothetical protein